MFLLTVLFAGFLDDLIISLILTQNRFTIAFITHFILQQIFALESF
jgi:hypothetical protein